MLVVVSETRALSRMLAADQEGTLHATRAGDDPLLRGPGRRTRRFFDESGIVRTGDGRRCAACGGGDGQAETVVRGGELVLIAF